MRITCPNCGGPHPKWECKKPDQIAAPKVAAKSLTAPRAMRGKTIEGKALPPVLSGVPSLGTESATSRIIVEVDPAGKDHSAEMIGQVEPNGSIKILSLTVRGTPRKRAPKGTFDRKAYQREAARKRRARLAAEKEAGK